MKSEAVARVQKKGLEKMKVLTVRADVGLVQKMDEWATRLHVDRSRIVSACFDCLDLAMARMVDQRIAEADALRSIRPESAALPSGLKRSARN